MEANPRGRSAARRQTHDAGAPVTAPHDKTPSAPDADLASRPPHTTDLGPTGLSPHDQTRSSGPDGAVDKSQPAVSRSVGDVMATPSMSSPAATRPMKSTNRSNNPEEASLSD